MENLTPITTKTTAPFSKKVTKSTTQVDTIEQKTLRNKAFAINSWLKPLLESIRCIECPNPNPPRALFLSEIEKTKFDTNDPEKLNLTLPDLFLRVKSDNADDSGYTAFLIHSLVLSTGPELIEAINDQKGNPYFTIDAPYHSKEKYTAKHVSKLVQFLYTGELAFEENDRDDLMLMAEDFGIDAFRVALQLAKERAEQDSNNPFKEKVENKKKFDKHRSEIQKSAKNKSVGKNRGEGSKMNENFKDFKAMVEFMKMMKN